MPETMRWAEQSNWDKLPRASRDERGHPRAEDIVAWVQREGGEARYEPESGSHTDMMLDPWHPARIWVRNELGLSYCAPGQWVVMGEWFDPGNGKGFDGIRAFTVSDVPPARPEATE